MQEYERIMGYLNNQCEDGKITEYVKRTLIDMTRKVLENLARNYENVKERVGFSFSRRVYKSPSFWSFFHKTHFFVQCMSGRMKICRFCFRRSMAKGEFFS